MSQTSDSSFKEGDIIVYCPKRPTISRGRQGVIVKEETFGDRKFAGVKWDSKYSDTCYTQDMIVEEKCRQCEYALVHIVNGRCPCTAHFKKREESIDT